ILELLVLIAVVASLGRVLSAWLNAWGVLLLIVIAGGMIAPLVLSWRSRRFRGMNMATAPVLALIGGFLLRVVIVFSAGQVGDEDDRVRDVADWLYRCRRLCQS